MLFGSNPINKPSLTCYQPKRNGPTLKKDVGIQTQYPDVQDLEKRIADLEMQVAMSHASINAMHEEMQRMNKDLKKKIKKVKVKRNDLHSCQLEQERG